MRNFLLLLVRGLEEQRGIRMNPLLPDIADCLLERAELDFLPSGQPTPPYLSLFRGNVVVKELAPLLPWSEEPKVSGRLEGIFVRHMLKRGQNPGLIEALAEGLAGYSNNPRVAKALETVARTAAIQVNTYRKTMLGKVFSRADQQREYSIRRAFVDLNLRYKNFCTRRNSLNLSRFLTFFACF